MYHKFLVIFLIILRTKICLLNSYNNLDLPVNHIKYHFNSFPNEKSNCVNDAGCIYNKYLKNIYGNYSETACWGYENDCDTKNRFSKPECKIKMTIQGQPNTKIFYHQADFGYAKDQINEISNFCEGDSDIQSSLECSKYLRFCRGKNILIDFSNISETAKPFRYKTDVLEYGQIGGYCKLKKDKLHNEMDHFGALQSWAPELRNFKEFEKPLDSTNLCDLIINKPTYIMKLDAQSNMYHHFCDFFNLYLSLHVNRSNVGFGKDVQIILWETYDYYSPFGAAFNAFTFNEVWTLKDVSGKKVCFKNLLLPLLPRMIFGLYYNTPIVANCSKSGLFKAFSEFFLHRLRVPLEFPLNSKKVRITFISRKTKFRRVLNEGELLKALGKNSNYIVRSVSFEAIGFRKQLEIVRNTDVLIGMHGAGLAHLIFLPDWATVFELYHCGDRNCYNDLARLRGIKYLTWEDTSKLYPEDAGSHPEVGAHEKFTNYRFDKKEFLDIVYEAVKSVRENEIYIKFISNESNQINESMLKKDEF